LEEAVLGFRTRVGAPCGEVLVNFVSPAAAEKCMSHFNGCQWDASGTKVTVRPWRPLAPASAPSPAAKQVVDLTKPEYGYPGHQKGAPAFVSLRSGAATARSPAPVAASTVAVGDTLRRAARIFGSEMSKSIGEVEAEKDVIKIWVPP